MAPRSPPVCPSADLGALPKPAPVRRTPVLASVTYDGAGQQLVHAMKYRGTRSVIPLIVRRLGPDLHGRAVDAVTWIPGSRPGRRRRVFEPAELLARAVAGVVGCRAVRLLRRADGAAQVGRGRHDRLRGPSLRARRGFDGRRVLLVDDVLTTGGSAAAALDRLASAGVSVEMIVVAAVVPPPDERVGTRAGRVAAWPLGVRYLGRPGS